MEALCFKQASLVNTIFFATLQKHANGLSLRKEGRRRGEIEEKRTCNVVTLLSNLVEKKFTGLAKFLSHFGVRIQLSNEPAVKKVMRNCAILNCAAHTCRDTIRHANWRKTMPILHPGCCRVPPAPLDPAREKVPR